MSDSLWLRLTALALVLSAMTLVGCNTIGGAGEDIQEGGEAIEETAEDIAD